MEAENRKRWKTMAAKISRITSWVIENTEEPVVRKGKGEACKRVEAKGPRRLQEVASPASKDTITTILVEQAGVYEIAASKDQ